ncbi:CLUMA_CG013646, isoform A, partial [Clunio marinus]
YKLCVKSVAEYDIIVVIEKSDFGICWNKSWKFLIPNNPTEYNCTNARHDAICSSSWSKVYISVNQANRC